MAVWTEETEDRMITMIQERPPLFDITDKLYSNRVVKTGLWREIEKKMILSEKELKKRWDSLRTQYTRYKRLPPAGTSGAQKTGRQQWILTRLQFLEPHTKRKETTSNLAIRENSLADSDSPSDGTSSETGTSTPLKEPSAPLKEPSSCEATTGTCTPLAESTICGVDSQPEALSSTSRSAAPRPPAKRSRRTLCKPAKEESSDESASEESSHLLLRTIRTTLECLNSDKEVDDIAVYCKMVESRMRKLPPNLLPYFQNEVDNCLFKYSVQSVVKD